MPFVNCEQHGKKASKHAYSIENEMKKQEHKMVLNKVNMNKSDKKKYTIVDKLQR